MSEIQTNTPEDAQFINRATKAALAIGAAGTLAFGAAAVHQENSRNEAHDTVLANDAQQRDNENQYHNSIEAAINQSYDKSQVLGEIPIAQGSSLIDPAEAIVENSLGTPAFDEAEPRIFSPLLDSAKEQNPQPGETYAVVAVDINPAQNDGNEFVVVNANNISESGDNVQLDAPLIDDSPSNEASN